MQEEENSVHLSCVLVVCNGCTRDERVERDWTEANVRNRRGRDPLERCKLVRMCDRDLSETRV